MSINVLINIYKLDNIKYLDFETFTQPEEFNFNGLKPPIFEWGFNGEIYRVAVPLSYHNVDEFKQGQPLLASILGMTARSLVYKINTLKVLDDLKIYIEKSIKVKNN